MEFNKKLKNLRELAEMSQKELADKIEVSTVMISQYENGKKMPGRDTLKRIAAVFDVSISDLLGDTQEDEQFDEIIILNRAARKMTPEKRKQLLEMAKAMFKEDFR